MQASPAQIGLQVVMLGEGWGGFQAALLCMSLSAVVLLGAHPGLHMECTCQPFPSLEGAASVHALSVNLTCTCVHSLLPVPSVPFEVRVVGDKEPVYDFSLEDLGRVNETVVLPFNAYGTLAWARNEFENNSASSQV